MERTSYAFHNTTAKAKSALKADSSHIDFSESSDRKAYFIYFASSDPHCYKYIQTGTAKYSCLGSEKQYHMVTNSVNGNGRNSIMHLNKMKLFNDYGHSLTGGTDLRCKYLLT